MRDVIEIYDGTKLDCTLKFIRGSVVGGEHDFFSADVCHVGELKLCDGAAVCPGTFLLHYFKECRVRCCLYSEIFAEGRSPGKSLKKTAEIFADSFFIVNVKWCRIFFYNFLKLCLIQRECFLRHFVCLLWLERGH